LQKLFSELQRLLQAGEDAVLVSILSSSGSAPRGAGARMLVGGAGRIGGSIGGGAVEYRSEQLALAALSGRKSLVQEYHLSRDLGMICGGNATVLFQFIAADDEQIASLCADALRLFAAEADIWLITKLTETIEAVNSQRAIYENLEAEKSSVVGEWHLCLIGGDGCANSLGLAGGDGCADSLGLAGGDGCADSLGLAGGDGCADSLNLAGSDGCAGSLGLATRDLQPYLISAPTAFKHNSASFYVEPIHSRGRVLIFGGGHVAQALAPLLVRLNFNCWVMDNRPELCAGHLFPDVKKVICGEYEDISRYIKIQPADYAVVMTHGHAADYIVQKQVMSCAPAYIGVIGSRNKIKTLSEKLTADGFSAQQLARVHAPIGLPIAAETPEEIAVSIAAELIMVRANAVFDRKGLGTRD